MANASIHATLTRPDRQYAANITAQTFTAGKYFKTGERGWVAVQWFVSAYIA